MAGSMTTVEVTVLSSQNRLNSKTQPALDQSLHLCPFSDLVQPEWKAQQPSNMQLDANALAIPTRSSRVMRAIPPQETRRRAE
ncbi:hypothetical protein Vi05172_g4730 [Venturia inaequalis]|nr:hypothetical protein Vi05172_g4730 [Venturia inaequalis]